MSTQLQTTHGGQMVTAEQAANLRTALQSSLYPGASDASVSMVLAYCQAAGLDPMTKPVHIVPISVKSGKKRDDGSDIYENRDVVMPGIGLYRVRAASTHAHEGTSDPTFGPMRTLNFRKKVTEWVSGKKQDKWVDEQLEYPEWCRVSVFRNVNGRTCEFPATEYWLENYATAGRNSDAPNEMWARRPRGQLVKCAEAQALRKAFPEFGGQPTAEEMEGRADVDAAPLPIAAVTTMPQRASVTGNTARPAPVVEPEVVDIDPDTGEVLDSQPTQAQQPAAGAELSAMPAPMRKMVMGKLEAAGLTLEQLAAAHPGIGSDGAKVADDFNRSVAWIKGQQ